MKRFVLGLGLLAVLPVTGCGGQFVPAALGAATSRIDTFLDDRAEQRDECEDEGAEIRQAMTAMILECARDKTCAAAEIDRRIAIVNKAVDIHDQCLDDVPFGRLIGGDE